MAAAASSSRLGVYKVEAPSQELLEKWLQRHADLLGKERSVEQEESRLLLSKCSPRLLERNGLAILGLGVASIAIGLGGKTLVELERPAAYHDSPQFPPHTMRPGDVVQLEDHSHDKTKSRKVKAKGKDGDGSTNHGADAYALPGVVYRVSDRKIVVAASSRRHKSEAGSSKDATINGDGSMPDLPARIRVVKVANDATFDRMEWGLTRVAKALNIGLKTSKRSVDAQESSSSEGSGLENTVNAPSSDTLRTSVDGPSTLLPALIGRSQPKWDALSDDIPPRLFSVNLNASQIGAIKFALGAQHFALIHGPPGTGKTTAVAELVLQMALTQQKTVLVCGASNLAADNLLERIVLRGVDALAKSKIGVTRIGHPARVLPSLVETTLDQQAQASSEGGLLKDVKKELEEALSSLRPKEAAGNKSTSSRGQASSKSQRVRGSERKERRVEIRTLRKEYRKRERQLLRTVLKRAGVVVATCHGAGGKQLNGIQFDAVVIDEACQATEASCWLPLLKAKPDGVAILAGDHLQLPPTVKGFRHSQMRKQKASKTVPSKGEMCDKAAGADHGKVEDATDDEGADGDALQSYAKEAGHRAFESKHTSIRPPRSLETTLFSRLLGMYGPGCKALLDTQYRMCNEIMAYPNEALYEGKIKADASCQEIRLADLEAYSAPEDDDLAQSPLVFYDTAGCEMYESQGGGQDSEGETLPQQMDSRANLHEVELVLQHVEMLVGHGLDPARISVLSPYNLQVRALSDRLRASQVNNTPLEGIVVGSIDSMQGMENDVVVLSLVRSNETHDVGFLAEHRRLNVAMTRAKRQLCVVGDSETVGGAGDDYLKGWMEHLEQHAFIEPVAP